MSRDLPSTEQYAIELSNRLRAAGPVPRRRFIQAIAALGALAMLPRGAHAQAAPPRFVSNPFTLGVGSGYPRADGVTLWTRLAPLPLQADGGLMPSETLPVTWQVAEDERFGRVVAEGGRRAVPETAHSVHIDVTGLRPDRPYFYRFLCGHEVSPTGRTRTAPAADSEGSPLRFAIASCQHYEQGHFSGYRHLIDDEPTLTLFLGDYIYRGSWGRSLVRRHHGGEPISLEEYRARHAQYKTDPHLQRAHGAMPWLVTWDDHEADNDYAGVLSEDLDPRFLLRRAAAYQAYFEHMPLPAHSRPRLDGSLRLYQTVDWGRQARFLMLDNRQYRSPQACPEPFKLGGSTTLDVATCPELADPARTLLGAEQERWVEQELGRGGVRWTVIGQQTLMADQDVQPGPGVKAWTDGWSGYPAARERFLDALRRTAASNPLVVGGDLHATVAGNLIPQGGSTPIASEICGTSMTADGALPEEMAQRMADNPHLVFGDGHTRGYVLLDVGTRAVDARLRGLDDVHLEETRVADVARFRVEEGRPGVQRVDAG